MAGSQAIQLPDAHVFNRFVLRRCRYGPGRDQGAEQLANQIEQRAAIAAGAGKSCDKCRHLISFSLVRFLMNEV